MTPPAIVLVIAGALCHAIWNYLAKRVSGGRQFVWLYGLVSSVFLLPWLIAQSSSLTNEITPWESLMPPAFGSAALHVVYALCLQRGYRVSDMSIVYPVARGSGPMFTVVCAVLWMRDDPTILGWFGIRLIFVGIMLIAAIHRVWRPRQPDAHSLQGIAWGLITGILIASYTLVDGWAVRAVGLMPLTYYAVCLWIRTAVLTPFILSDRAALKRQWAQNWRSIAAVGLLSPVAYLLTLQAMTMAPVSYVAPAREISLLFGAALATWLLGEALNRWRIAGTVCIAVGVVLVGLA